MVFLESKRYFFESPLQSKLGIVKNSAVIDRTLFSWAACCDGFSQKFRSVHFSSKKAEFFEFFQNRFNNPHFPLIFLFLRSFSTDAFAGSISLIHSCIDNVVIDPGWSFRRPKFLAKTFERPDFIRKQVLRCAFFRTLYHVRHPNSG